MDGGHSPLIMRGDFYEYMRVLYLYIYTIDKLYPQNQTASRDMTRPDHHICFQSLSLQRAHGQGPRPAGLVKAVGQKQGLGEQEPKEVDEDGHSQPVPERLPADGREAV